MTRQSHVAAYPDRVGEDRTRIAAANGDILFVSTQRYDNEDGLIIARELARQTLNDEIDNDPAYRARVDALMAQRDAKSAQFPAGGASAHAPAGVENAPPSSKLADALSRRAGIGSPTLDRLFGLGPNEDGQS